MLPGTKAVSHSPNDVVERSSEFEINHSHFSDIQRVEGNVYFGHHSDPHHALRKSIEKDVDLNGFSPTSRELRIPRFSKALLVKRLSLTDVGYDSKMGAGSCAFDLASRLSLLPGQINSHLAEYDEGVPIDDIVTRGSCYCGRISRHGLIYLVSQHLQNISLSETSTGTKCIAISTSLGRFKCYEKDDRTFVHFDGTTRSSYLPLVRDQNLEEILQTAQGQYLINDSAEHRDFIWRQSSMDALEYLATGNFYGIPNAIMYMPRETLDRWKRLKQFSWAMADAMLSVIETVHEPASFVLALNNLPKGSSAGLKNKLAMESPAEKLAACVYLCRVLSRKSITEMDFEYFHMYARMNMQDLTEAHQLYRSPRAESSKLFSTSQDRFMRLLREYTMVDNASGRHSDPSLRTELQGLLLSNRNNVALVVFQGFLAIVSLWNSSRVLMRAREAPEEWIRFVVADDDDVFLG